MERELINHPDHYGGDTTYEAIKVIEAHRLNFRLGNVIKYILRSAKKETLLADLQKAKWYLEREIQRLENGYTEDGVTIVAPPLPNTFAVPLKTDTVTCKYCKGLGRLLSGTNKDPVELECQKCNGTGSLPLQ